MLLQLVAVGIKLVLCDSTGRGLLEACTWFPPDLVPGSFADFTLHPTGISLSCQCSHMLSLVSPPSEMSNLGVVLGTPDTDPKYINILRGHKI